jgi:replicative DNA helicase
MTVTALATAARPMLPINYDAEKAFLGAVLANNEVFYRVADFLRPEHFADALHGRIFESIRLLLDRGFVANAVTLKNQFDHDGALTQIGGAKYLVDLSMSVVTVLNAEDYARTVYDLFLRRELIAQAERIIEDARVFNPEVDAASLVERAESGLFTIAGGNTVERTAMTLAQCGTKALERIEMARKQGYSGVSTGLRSLDKKLGGLKKDMLIILGGRPSMGKTALARNIAYNVAAQALENADIGAVAFFSQEMDDEEIVMNGWAAETGISYFKMVSGNLSDAEFTAIAEADRRTCSLPVVIDDEAGLTASQIGTRARRIQRKMGLSLIVVDHAQISGTDRKTGDMRAQVTDISLGLKRVAKRLEVPVLLLSQLSRAVELREDKRPVLSDLRESGSLEQDADVVIFLYREGYYLLRSEPHRRPNEGDEAWSKRRSAWERACEDSHNVSEAIISKQRGGPIGKVKLFFDPVRNLFTDLQGEQ